MKTIRYYQQAFSLFLACLTAFGTSSCYSSKQIQTPRLPRINAETLQYIIVDPDAPQTNMWLLSNVKTEETALTASVERPSREFVQKFSASRKRSHRNHVLLYVRPEIIKTYPDVLASTRLNYTDITKVEIFEPDGGKAIGLVLAGIALAAGAGLLALYAKNAE